VLPILPLQRICWLIVLGSCARATMVCGAVETDESGALRSMVNVLLLSLLIA